MERATIFHDSGDERDLTLQSPGSAHRPKGVRRALLLGAFALLGLGSGCQHLTERGGETLVARDKAGQTVTLGTAELAGLIGPDGRVDTVALQTALAGAAAQNPAFDPSTLAGVEVVPGEVAPSAALAMTAEVLQTLPVPGAAAAALALNGLLAGAVAWQRNRRGRAEKTSEALVRGIDTFRDILDQTPSGAIIDAHLTRVLGEEKLRAGQEVVTAIADLLARLATPDKPAGGLDLGAAPRSDPSLQAGRAR